MKTSIKPIFFFSLFVVVNLLLSSWFPDQWKNDNTSSRVLPIVSFYENGTLNFDNYQQLTGDKSFVNQHYYSDKAPLPLLTVLPFFGLIKTLGLTPFVNGSLLSPQAYAWCGFFGGTIPFMVILILTFISVKMKNGFSKILLISLPFYASFVFVYTGTFFGHLFAGCLLLASYILLKKDRFIWAGLFLGLTFISEYPVAIIGLIWAIQLIFKRNLKSSFLFSLGIVPSLLFILIYNKIFTGSWFTMLYKFVPVDYEFMQHNYGMSLPKISALWGLLFSQYRGLLFYAPFLIIAGFYWLKTQTRISMMRLPGNYLFMASLATILLISSFQMWWGGWCYGPRHLTGIAVLLIYEGIQYLSRIEFNKKLVYGFISFGLLCAFLAKVTIVYSLPTAVKFPLAEIIRKNVFAGNFNSNNILTQLFHVQPLISSIIFSLVFVTLFWFMWKLEKRQS